MLPFPAEGFQLEVGPALQAFQQSHCSPSVRLPSLAECSMCRSKTRGSEGMLVASPACDDDTGKCKSGFKPQLLFV